MSFEQPTPPFNASDPTASFLSTSCLDFLMIELVPMAYRVANELEDDNRRPQHQKQAQSQQQQADPAAAAISGGGAAAAAAAATGAGAPPAGNGDGSNGAASASRPSSMAGTTGTGTGTAGAGRGGRKLDEEEERDAVFYRLETLGYRVGLGLVERFSRDRPRINDSLDAIKFVCKDLWMLVFKKQVDNLKTNHRGVYVLTDNVFRPLARMSADAGGQAVARAQPFLWFPCGVLRGALAAMGINASVQAESSELPGAVFQIKTLSSKQ